jgi:hypothetical protein
MGTQAIFLFGVFVTVLLGGGLIMSIREIQRLERTPPTEKSRFPL